jgi:hypothetical protein
MMSRIRQQTDGIDPQSSTFNPMPKSALKPRHSGSIAEAMAERH